jgi:hypothetical protein
VNSRTKQAGPGLEVAPLTAAVATEGVRFVQALVRVPGYLTSADDAGCAAASSASWTAQAQVHQRQTTRKEDDGEQPKP